MRAGSGSGDAAIGALNFGPRRAGGVGLLNVHRLLLNDHRIGLNVHGLTHGFVNH